MIVLLEGSVMEQDNLFISVSRELNHPGNVYTDKLKLNTTKEQHLIMLIEICSEDDKMSEICFNGGTLNIILQLLRNSVQKWHWKPP